MMMATHRHGIHYRSHIRSLCAGVAVFGALGLGWLALIGLARLVVWLAADAVMAATSNPFAATWIALTALASWGAWALRGEG